MSRVKMFGIVARRVGMELDEFHDYWRHPHGTWGQHISTTRGYVQSHQLHTDLLGTEQSRYGGAAEHWFDNEDDLRTLTREPFYVEYLREDEPRFGDMPNCIFFATEEEVLLAGPRLGAHLNPGDDFWSPTNRPFSIKLLHFVGPDAGPHWARPHDGELGLRLGALRHVRCHPLRSFHGDTPPFSGVQELWWPTVSAFRAGVSAARAAWTALLADAGRSVTFLAQAERYV
jgi:hypothetical protein